MELPANTDPDVKRVLVGIPLKGHTPPASYHDRLLMAYNMGALEVQSRFEGLKPRFEFVWVTAGEIFIPYAREMLADQALRLDCDYLFMVDDDMLAMPDLFYRLVKHDVDIVAPLAFTRNPPHNAVMFSVVEGFDPVTGTPYYINNIVKNYPREKLVECDAVGFGAVLIKTSVLKGMKKQYFMGTPGAGEDVHFCVQAKKAGFHIFMDTATKLGHLSHPIVVTEQYSDDYNGRSAEEKEKFFGEYTKYPSMAVLK